MDSETKAIQDQPAAWLEDHLPLVNAVVKQVARAARVHAQDVPDLQSAVFTKLVRNDYRALRSFRGDAQIRTFLVVVVRRVLLDLRNSAWGRRRPPARTDRLRSAADVGGQGPADGGRSSQVGTLRRARAFSPVPLPLSLDGTIDVASDVGCPHNRLVDADRKRVGASVARRLHRALVELPRDDRQLVNLRHGQGLQVSQIAALLGVNQQRLYKRLYAIHRDLRVRITALGVSGAEAVDLTGWGPVHVPDVLSRTSSGPR